MELVFPPSLPSEDSQLHNLVQLLGDFRLSHGSDSWIWALESSGSFSVNSLYKLVKSTFHGPAFWPFPWNKTAPIKANILGWRIEQDRLPTKVQLAKRNVNIPSNLCPLCNIFEETTSHLFIQCHFAQSLWSLLTNWCKIPPRPPDDIHGLLSAHLNPLIDPRKAQRINLIIIAFCSVIWSHRNDALFNNRTPAVHLAFNDLRSLSFQWFSTRGKLPKIPWEEWSQI